MSGMIHKMEEEIKQKMKNVFHLGHKEKDTHKESKHKVEHGGDGQHLKGFMHKIKKKMGRRRGKRGRGKDDRRQEGEKSKEGEGKEEEEEEDEEEESESESDSDNDSD